MEEENNLEVEEIDEVEEKLSEKKKKSSKKIRFTAFLILLGLLSSYVAYSFNNNIKVKKAKNTSEIETLFNNDNAMNSSDNSRDILFETKSNVDKIWNYLNISKTLDGLYCEYGDKITNLNFGEAAVSDGTIVGLSDEEYTELLEDLKFIESKNGKDEDDEFYQTVGKVVSKSSAVNGWLLCNAPKLICDTLLLNCANDVAFALDVDFQTITVDYNYENNELSVMRNDNGVGESMYNVKMKGIRNSQIKEHLVDFGEIFNLVSSFLNSGNQSLYDDDGNCLMTFGENGGLVVLRNSDFIDELEKGIKIIQIVACSDYKINKAEFSYDVIIPDRTYDGENVDNMADVSSMSKSASVYTRVLKR